MTDPRPLAITWTEKTVPVANLKPYERNPRTISREDFFKLKKSLRETGYHSRIKAQPDLRIIGGHYRQKALMELGIKEIIVLVPDRELTDDEFKRVMIQDNLSFGSFDVEILSSDFDGEELMDWGVPERLIDEGGENIASAGSESSAGSDEGKTVTCPHCQTKFTVS